MPHLLAFRIQVMLVELARFDHDGDAFVDDEAVAVDADHFHRVVREQAEMFHAEVEQDLRADAVFAEVGRESEADVRLDGVAAFLLELVRAELVREPDAASFLASSSTFMATSTSAVLPLWLAPSISIMTRRNMTSSTPP